jgi:hypothetical protein
MNLPKKLRSVLILAVVFSVAFLVPFLAILVTQSPYSTPATQVVVIDGGMDFSLGPPPNATNVPLNTAVTVEALASAGLNDLRITPDVPIAWVGSTTTGPLTYLNLFYPSELLKPSTLYNVSVTIMNSPVSWVFTTTNEPFKPSISFFLATNELWISLSIAALVTVIAGLAVWFTQKRQK